MLRDISILMHRGIFCGLRFPEWLGWQQVSHLLPAQPYVREYLCPGHTVNSSVFRWGKYIRHGWIGCQLRYKSVRFAQALIFRLRQARKNSNIIPPWSWSTRWIFRIKWATHCSTQFCLLFYTSEFMGINDEWHVNYKMDCYFLFDRHFLFMTNFISSAVHV